MHNRQQAIKWSASEVHFFMVAGYGRLRLLVNQGDVNFRGLTRELTLEHVANALNLGKHNLISTKRLTRVFDQPMRVNPNAAAIQPWRGVKPLVFYPLCRENGLLEIRVRRLDQTKTKIAKHSASSYLVAVNRKRQDIMKFHRVLRHLRREITAGNELYARQA